MIDERRHDGTPEASQEAGSSQSIVMGGTKIRNYGQYVSGGILVNHYYGASHQATSFYDVPSLQVRNFVQRKALFSRMEALLEKSDTSSLDRIVILCGMGGAGKTQLALRYCHHSKRSRKRRAIFWLDASSRNALLLSMEAVANKLLPGRVLRDPREAVLLVRESLSSWTDKWLLIFDNLDDLSDLKDIKTFFPDSDDGSILVTSRNTGSRELGEVITVDRMEESEGLELLCRSSQVDMKERAAAQDILKRLEYLPLAIDQVRAYISHRELPLMNFVVEYERRKAEFMAEGPQFSSYFRMVGATQELATLTVMTTWEMSFNLLDVGEAREMKLRDILTVFAFFHPFKIGEKLFSADCETDSILSDSPLAIFHEGNRWNHQKFERAVVQMQEHSLLRFSRREDDEIVVTLHSMVSEWLQMRLKRDEGSLSAYLRNAASHLATYVYATDELDHRLRREALSHMDAICRNEGFLDVIGAVCDKLGVFYVENARLQDAGRMYNHALAGYEQALGPDHTCTLDTVNNLGLLYAKQGRLSDAGRMYGRALAGKEKALGADHTSTLNTVTNLGVLYAQQGRLSDAESMYSRALAGYEKALGADHTSTLNTVNNLGNLYSRQGRLSDAERLYSRSLAGYEKALGHDHTSTLNTVNNLGVLYADQGQLFGAERMYGRALAGFEKAFGLDHTSTLDTVNNLGVLYAKQSRLSDAERMYGRALAGYEKALGSDHTSTLDTVINLGNLYVDQGRLLDAERMYSRALAGKEKVLGPDHPSTLDTVNNLGLLYANQGRLSDAEGLYSRALAGKQKALGHDHTSTLDTVNNLGVLYADQGQLSDAERMYGCALAGKEKALGPDHTSTLDTVMNLGNLYVDQGRLSDAEGMYGRALAGYKKALGPDHTSTLDTVSNLGLLYAVQGRLSDAERVYRRALGGYEKALGPDHASTLDIIDRLKDLLVDHGRSTS